VRLGGFPSLFGPDSKILFYSAALLYAIIFGLKEKTFMLFHSLFTLLSHLLILLISIMASGISPWIMRYAILRYYKTQLSITTIVLDQVQTSVSRLEAFIAAPSVASGRALEMLNKGLYDRVPWDKLKY